MLPLPIQADTDNEPGLVGTLFRRLDEAGVVYCHFKSNAFLAESLAGDSDLDVLVDRRQAALVNDVLAGLEFRLFRSAFLTRYPSVEDHLGHDPVTGRLIHLHLHYRLVAGARALKGHELTWANDVLATRVLDPTTGVFTSSPAHELVLLLVRAALKVTWLDALRGLGRGRHVRGRARQEFEWLCERASAAEVQAIVRDELGSDAAALVPDLMAAPPSVVQLLTFRWRAREALRLCRRESPLEGAIIQSTARAMGLLARLNRRLLHQPRPFRRTPSAGGLSIAFLGTHGAGKSTVTREIERWLGAKADVYRIYFGSGTGTSSLLRWPMKVMADLRRRVRPASRRPKPAPDAEGRRAQPDEKRWLAGARVMWALALALEKRSKLERSLRARRRGMIVICDRYPQVEVLGYNDGPLLGAWLTSSSRIRRALARFERRIYERAVDLAPDLIIKLDVLPEVAAGRRPEESLDELHRRRDAVRRIHYGERCRHVVIDASSPVDDVLRAVKRTVWSAL